MSDLWSARRPARLAAGVGLVLLATLVSLLVVARLLVPPAARPVAVGRVPMAVVVDERTRRVFMANLGSNTVSMLDADSGAVLATIPVAPNPSALAVATAAGRVFVVSDDLITLSGIGSSQPTVVGTGHVSVLDAASGRRLRTVAVGQGTHTLAVHE